MNDRMIADEVKMATAALNRAIQKAANAGLLVSVVVTGIRAVSDPADVPLLSSTVSRPL